MGDPVNRYPLIWMGARTYAPVQFPTGIWWVLDDNPHVGVYVESFKSATKFSHPVRFEAFDLDEFIIALTAGEVIP